MLRRPDSDESDDPGDLLRGIHVSPQPGLPPEYGLGALLAVVLVVMLGVMTWFVRSVRLRRRNKHNETTFQ